MQTRELHGFLRKDGFLLAWDCWILPNWDSAFITHWQKAGIPWHLCCKPHFSPRVNCSFFGLLVRSCLTPYDNWWPHLATASLFSSNWLISGVVFSTHTGPAIALLRGSEDHPRCTSLAWRVQRLGVTIARMILWADAEANAPSRRSPHTLLCVMCLQYVVPISKLNLDLN